MEPHHDLAWVVAAPLLEAPTCWGGPPGMLPTVPIFKGDLGSACHSLPSYQGTQALVGRLLGKTGCLLRNLMQVSI